MKKKSVKTKSTRAIVPPTAQLEAVHKLSRSGRHEQARERLRQLRTRYPDFKPLIALAWEVEDNAGFALSAASHAWDWIHSAPGSLAALEALQVSAIEAGLTALSLWAARRLAQAQDLPFPELPPVPGPLAELHFDQAVAIDLARLLMSVNRFSETIDVLQGIDHPSARNDLAMAQFAQGDIALAQAGFESVWRQDRRNLFALHYVIRLRLWTSGRVPAAELLDSLRTMQPLRPEDAYGKMFALLLLDAHDAAISTWDALRDADFWDSGYLMENSRCAFFAGLAAQRLGDTTKARDLFSESINIWPGNLQAHDAFASTVLSIIDARSDLPAGEFRDWFPQSFLTAYQATRDVHAKDALFDAQVQTCTAHPDYLATAAELGDTVVRRYAIGILKWRAGKGDPAAIATLRSLLTRPCGPDSVRAELDAWLQENGMFPQGQPHPLRMHGKIQELIVRPLQLHAKFKESGLPEAAQAKIDHMRRLTRQCDLTGALRIGEELVAAYPHHPMPLVNLAGVKDALQHDIDQIEALFQRAAELDPAYLFAQSGLASIAARRGDPERARELLAPVLGREKYHYSEWRTILGAQREIARALKNRDAESAINAMLDALHDEFG